VRAVRPVEADDSVEMDDAAPLVFGGFGERDAEVAGQGRAADSRLAGERAAQGDREAAPQFGSVGVEQDGAGVVVAAGAQRLTE